jgi:hypothetical protein
MYGKSKAENKSQLGKMDHSSVCVMVLNSNLFNRSQVENFPLEIPDGLKI